MLLGSLLITRVACAIARRVAPCITTTGGSAKDVVTDDTDFAFVEDSSVVVRVGAARVGAKECWIGDVTAEGTVDGTTEEAAEGAVDFVDWASSETICGGLGLSTVMRRFEEVFGTGLRIEMPRVPKTLLAVFRRPGVLPGRVFSLEEEPWEVTVACVS